MTPQEKSVETILALLEQELRTQREEMHELKSELKGLRTDVTDIKNQAARWKGGFGVILLVGAFFGWLISTILPFLKG